ncbi:MAG: insulinase family protein, partial [Candidatus Gastranaerophilales bacterium]|nr:insulinase family protein [Candidatus Gastranaerophilales bacterium]
MVLFQNTAIYPQQGWYNYNPPQRTAAYPQVAGSFNAFYPAPQPQYAYNSPHTASQPQGINPAMRSQIMPIIKRGPGYTELFSFNVPYLNEKGRLYKLDNGQGVVIIPKKGPTSIKTFVKVGSFNEPDKLRGISHYIEHNLFNGSEGLAPNQFVENVTRMGGLYNASTDTSRTDYYIKSPLHKETDLPKFIQMHANMVHFPSFTDEMLEKERGPVISEIRMYEDNSYDKAYNTMVKNLFGINADYQGLIAGSAENIRNVTKKDVEKYYNTWYTPENMVTVVVGEVDPDSTITLLSREMNRKKATPANNDRHYQPLNLTEKTVRQDIIDPLSRTVMLEMGFAGPKNNDIKDTLAATALLTSLAGYENAPLAKAMKPFNSVIAANMGVLSSDYNAPQLIELNANFTPGQEEEGLKTIYSVLHGAAQQPLSEKELETAKNKMKNSLLSASENSMNIVDMVGNSILGNGNIAAYTQIVEGIDALTVADIQNAARKYLNLNRASIVMLHPEASQTQPSGANSLAFGRYDPANAKDKFNFTNVREYDLPNKLRLVINDNPDSIKASANLKLKTDVPVTNKPGVADVLTLMLNKGTKNYSEDQLNELIDTYNLGISAGAESHSLKLTANCPKERLPMAMRVMKEMIYNPDLTQEKFDRAKEEVRLQFNSMPKDPGDRALEELYPDYPWGETARKVLEQLDNITLNDVKHLHQALIANSQGIMTVDAPVSKTPELGHGIFAETQIGMAFNKSYHPVPQQDSIMPTKPVVIAESEKRNQADIVQVFKIKESGNIKDHAALMLLNEILGGNSTSRLFMDLRETQKLAYRVKSIYNSDGKYGNIALTIKTTTEDAEKGASHENLQKSLNGFRNHINRLITTPV